jgi:L-alanine-DL-glutamate epimerase-like enolase superfamily enzyme
MSTIRQVEAQAVNTDYRVQWTSHAKSCFVTTTIVRVTDSDGVQGIGGIDSFTPGQGDLSVLEAVRSLAPAFVGRESSDREAFAQELRVGVVFPFSPGPLAVLDIALWDLAARRARTPLFRLLGAVRERITAYASLETMECEDDYLEVVTQAKESGLRAIKVHAWGEPDRDVSLFGRLRTEHPDLTLMHDAEGVYDHRGALRAARALEELDCRWLEAPLPDFDLTGYRELRRRVDVPILPAGYAMWDVRQLVDALRDAPWSAARSDVTCTLGITGLRKLSAVAQAFDMDLEPVSYGHALTQFASLHVMLASSNVSYFEMAYPTEPWEFGVVNPIRADAEGMVTVPEADGLGIELDWELLESRTIAKCVAC